MDTCIDCKKEISLTCVVCPSCGRTYPVGHKQREQEKEKAEKQAKQQAAEEQKFGNAFAVIVIGVVLVFGYLVIFSAMKGR